MSDQLIAGLVAIGTLVAVVALRSGTAGKVEITLNDAVIAAIAVGLVLLVTGKLAKIAVGGQGVTIETAREAILSSARQPIAAQVTPLPVAPLQEAIKGGIDQIPGMVRNRVQGLDFILGFGGYAPGAIREYLEALTSYDFFRYVVVLESDGRLFGIVDARWLLALLRDPASEITFDSFADALNHADAAARGGLVEIPGFVTASEGVDKQADKRDVLARMEETGSDWLPVVGEDGRFEGIVERSRLTASMILDVTDRLSEAPPPN